MDMTQMVEAVEVLKSVRYVKNVIPFIVEKRSVVVASICHSDEKDEFNRGWNKALLWMLGLDDTLQAQIDAVKERSEIP